MSKQKYVIEIAPPTYLEVRETMEVRGFRCPNCNGRGGFNEQTGFNEYQTTECGHCEGTGKVRAKVLVSWKPDFD